MSARFALCLLLSAAFAFALRPAHLTDSSATSSDVGSSSSINSPTPAPSDGVTLIRFVNAVPSDTDIMAFLSPPNQPSNTTAGWIHVAFGEFSSWVSIPRGIYELKVYEDGISDRELFSAQVGLDTGSQILVIAGMWPPTSWQNLLVLSENFLPTPDHTGVRVANLSPDSPSVDFLLNGNSFVSSVSFGSASAWSAMPRGETGNYSVVNYPGGPSIANGTFTTPNPPAKLTTYLIGLANTTNKNLQSSLVAHVDPWH